MPVKFRSSITSEDRFRLAIKRRQGDVILQLSGFQIRREGRRDCHSLKLFLQLRSKLQWELVCLSSTNLANSQHHHSSNGTKNRAEAALFHDFFTQT